MKILQKIKLAILLLSVLVFFDACKNCQDSCPTNSTCIDNVCVCNEGYSGVDCATYDVCVETNCPENAVCVDGTCICIAGYLGVNCDVQDPCFNLVCPTNAVCEDGNCVCEDGFIGVNCDIQDPCFNVVCPTNATCEDGNCVCEDGFFGVNCDIQDPCFNVVCPTNAECEDGDCYCFPGYQGTQCEIEIREKYLGTYAGTDVCPSATYVYTANIINSSANVAEFLIDGFGGFGGTPIAVPCLVLDEDDFEIIETSYEGISNIRSIPDLNSRQGIYNLQTGEVSVTYEVTFDNGTVEVCDLILTPQ